MKYIFAIRDINDGAVHSSRYSCLDDAMSAAEELAYDMEMDISDLEVVKLVERVNSNRKVVKKTEKQSYRIKVEPIEMKHFINYVLSFYAKGEIYDMGATEKEIKSATLIYIKRLEQFKVSFEGDTIDREAVRDIILESRVA